VEQLDIFLAVVHARRILTHMGLLQPQATPIYVGNTAAAQQSKNDSAPRKARHLSPRAFKVRELVLGEQIIAHWAPGGRNISGLLTKNVTKQVMETLRPLILSPVA
jgi:hypothetical protein